MENTLTFNKLNGLRGHVGPDFIAAAAFVTYLLRNSYKKPELVDAEHYWNEGDIELTIRTLEGVADEYKNRKESKDYILSNVISDACQILAFFSKSISKANNDTKESLNYLIKNISNEEIFSIVSSFIYKDSKYGSCDTAISVCELSKSLLDIKETDVVADLCCGQGRFLSSIRETNNVYGYDVNFDSLLNAYKTCLLSGKEAKLFQQDILTTKSDIKFDKIFMEYPWGLIYQRPVESLHSERWEPLSVGDLKRSMTSWLFIAKALSMLKENGLAVIHVNDGSLFSTYEQEIRKQALEKGLVKAVISLPTKINGYCNLKTSLLVLSKGNTFVRFIDASNLGTIDRRTKNVVFTEEDIKHISYLLKADIDSDISIKKHTLDLVVEGKNLDVKCIIAPKSLTVKIADGKKVDDVQEQFIRSVISNSCFLVDDKTTGIRVLSSADIQDGSVDIKKLPFLSEEGVEHLVGKWKENLLKDGDVVMTNKSTTIKSAVVDTQGEQIILFGSLVGIRAKREVINPYYLCAFINSNAGQMLLKSIQTGATIQMITLNNLRELLIPCPTIEKQNHIVEDLNITLEMIRESRNRILKLQQQYESSFDDLFVEE